MNIPVTTQFYDENMNGEVHSCDESTSIAERLRQPRFHAFNGLFPLTDPDSYCDPDSDTIPIVTARKRSLRRLCFYRCLSVHSGGGSASVHAGRPPCQGDPPEPLARETPLQGVTPARETPLPERPPCQGDPLPPSRPIPKGEIEGDQVQAHTQGGNWGGSDPGQHPRGKLRGDQIQAHTQGGNLGGSDPGPQLRGKLRGITSRPTARGKFGGIRSRPTSKGEIQGDQNQTPPPMTTAVGGTHPTGMHSCWQLELES